jgi:hypothetical protein
MCETNYAIGHARFAETRSTALTHIKSLVALSVGEKHKWLIVSRLNVVHAERLLKKELRKSVKITAALLSANVNGL